MCVSFKTVVEKCLVGYRCKADCPLVVPGPIGRMPFLGGLSMGS